MSERQTFSKSIKISSKPDKFCPGCGHSIVLKTLGSVIDEMNIGSKVLFGIDIGCSLLAWDYFDLKTIQTHHGRTVPVVSGYKVVKKNNVGIAYVGDGGAYAIGLQSLIHAANRNDSITVFVINNTVYGMTGGQMAPTTLTGEITSTTPSGKNEKEKGGTFLGPELLSKIPNKKIFLARTSCDKPILMKNFLRKALENQINNNSFSLVEILSMCPTNWRKNAKQSLEFLNNKMKKEFVLGEIKNDK